MNETLLYVLAGAVILFVVLRAAMLWYWKVNEQMALLKEQTQLLREIRDGQQARDAGAARPKQPETRGTDKAPLKLGW